MSDSPMRKHARAYDEVVRQAVILVESARCNCHACWTDRGQHDPKGCLWFDIVDLRAAVEDEQKARAAWQEANASKTTTEQMGIAKESE